MYYNLCENFKIRKINNVNILINLITKEKYEINDTALIILEKIMQDCNDEQIIDELKNYYGKQFLKSDFTNYISDLLNEKIINIK